MEKKTGLRGCSRLSNLVISPPGIDTYKPIVRKMNKHIAARMRAAVRMCSREPVTVDSLTLAVTETVAAMAAKCPTPDRAYSQPGILGVAEEEGRLHVHTYSRNGLPNIIMPCLYKNKTPKSITVLQRRALVSAAVPLIIAMAIDDSRLPPFNPTP